MTILPSRKVLPCGVVWCGVTHQRERINEWLLFFMVEFDYTLNNVN